MVNFRGSNVGFKSIAGSASPAVLHALSRKIAASRPYRTNLKKVHLMRLRKFVVGMRSLLNAALAVSSASGRWEASFDRRSCAPFSPQSADLAIFGATDY